MSRSAALASLLVLATGCSGDHTRTLGGYGLSLSLPRDWHGLAAPGQLQAADFPLPRSALASAARVRVARGHVHVIVWDYGPALPGRARSPLHGRVTFRSRDVTGPFEGFPLDHAFAIRSVNLEGELVEILADLGPRPLDDHRLRLANRVVGTLQVVPPAVVRPRGRVLSRDGVSLRLLPGWAGRIVVPPNRLAVNFVLFARRGATRVALLDAPPGFPAKQPGLPLTLARYTRTYARRQGLVAGHGIDVSASFASARGLADAQRLLATLKIEPRPWKLALCGFSLRVPGTLKAGIRRRGSCYLVVTLRDEGMRIVIRELRPGDHRPGMTLRRAGRRFHADVEPAVARATAAAHSILGTLRAKPISR